MKLKICLLLLILSVGYESLANAIVDRSNFSNNSSISKSSIVRSSIYENDEITIQDYKIMIENLNKQIQENPDNYSLYVLLIDLYLRNQNYKEAYKNLLFLYWENNKNKLPVNVVNELIKLNDIYKTKIKYITDKSSLYANLAILNLLLGNNTYAKNCMKNSVINVIDPILITNGISFIFFKTNSYEEGISTCNLYLSLNKNNKLNIVKLKLYFLIKEQNLNLVLSEYNKIIESGNDISNMTKYELFQLLSKNKISDKKIVEILYGHNNKDLARAYFDLFILLNENHDYKNIDYFAKKICDKFPNSLYSNLLEAEMLINQGKNKEAYEKLKIARNKILTDQDIIIFNRILTLISLQPAREATMLFKQGHYKQALDILNNKNIFETEQILAIKASCCIKMGKMQEALEYLNRAIAYDPNNYAVNLQFAYYYFYNREYELARKYAEKSLQESRRLKLKTKLVNDLLDEINKKKVKKYLNLIEENYNNQNYYETKRLINEALKIDPKSSFVYLYKGLINISENNYAASTAALYKAIELDENNALAYYYLGIAFDNLSEQKNALSCYENFIKLLPQDEYQENEKVEYAKNRIQKIKRTK